jgi:hypothetical protein
MALILSQMNPVHMDPTLQGLSTSVHKAPSFKHALDAIQMCTIIPIVATHLFKQFHGKCFL